MDAVNEIESGLSRSFIFSVVVLLDC